jgi:hypothetical protein
MRWQQGLRSVKYCWQRLRRLVGLRRRKGRAKAVAMTGVVGVVLLALSGGGLYTGLRYEHGRQDQAVSKRAMTIATTQLAALRTAGRLALGKQCFDSRGTPKDSTDPDAPCSYYLNAMASGCLSYVAQCYTVRIQPATTEGPATAEQVAVTYTIMVTWGKAGKLVMAYRLVQANQAYNVNVVHPNDVNVPEDTSTALPISTSYSQRTSGVKAINRLSDISGGPSVGLSTSECEPTEPCYGAAGKYSLAGVFTVATNIPAQLINGCTWDFGGGSTTVEVAPGQPGCDDGQVMRHGYQSAWQLQNLPPFPQACFAPLGSGVDTHVFLVGITLHTTEGVDVSTKAPLQLILPSCAP